MRIVFAGTPEFALAPLEALAASLHTVVAVYTQPDRPAGRGRALTPGPVKSRALSLNLPVLQPRTLRDAHTQAGLAALKPDLMVVVAYGLILPPAVLDIPKHGCVNIHASLLPRWRGAAPIQRAILAGDQETGITLMQMDAGLDTGPLLLQLPCAIDSDDSAGRVHDRLAALGAEALLRMLPAIESATHRAQPQPEAGATYANKIDKRESLIDWRQPALAIARQIRAFNPWPVAASPLGGKTVRIWQARVLSTGPAAMSPGHIAAAGPEGVDVVTGAGLLRVQQLQWPGGRVLSAAEAANGRALVGRQFETVA
ncbi:MAG: methionyl-tRNA formyltransferase [Nevskiales bacterium]